MPEEKQLTGYPSIDKPWLKYYSEEAIHAPLPECTIYEYLWENNKDHLDDVALNYFDRKITFGEMFTNIENAAKSFSVLGVKQGDIVIMATVTTPETVYALYGLNRIGAISNMVDPRTSAEGIKEYITEVNAKYVLVLDAAYSKMEEAITGTNVEAVIVTSPADSLLGIKKMLYKMSNRIKGNTPRFSDICLRWNDFILSGKNITPQFVSYQKDTCCAIVHTGGTTGLPKGVMLSNDNFNAASHQAIHSPIQMKYRDTFLNIMPPFIAYGVVLGIHTALAAGWQSYLIPAFKPEEFDALLQRNKPAGIMGVPSYFENLMSSKQMERADLSYAKTVLVGGDKTSAEFEESVNQFFASHNCGIHISKGYSMTEASSTATISFEIANKIGSNGIPLSKTIVSAFEEGTDHELPFGNRGEICISSPTIMLGYYENLSETQNVLRTHSDGKLWIHTGDLGYVDQDGFVFIDGRIKRVIICNDGFKVFPSFVEKVISGHPAIEDCCVVAGPDRSHSWGHLPVVYAVVKMKEAHSDDRLMDELKMLCQKELPEYAQPVEFRLIDSLPLTPIGKVDYRALEKAAAKE